MTASAAARCYPGRRLSAHYNRISFSEFQRFPRLGLVKPEILALRDLRPWHAGTLFGREPGDAIVEMRDKLITAIHNKARERREDRLLATDEARRRAVEVLEELGTLVLDTSIPDEKLRAHFRSVAEC